MLRRATAFIAIAFASFGHASAESVKPVALPDQQNPVYVQIIVKACHPAEKSLEPINQGKVYNEEEPMSLEERKAMWVELGCIDVPIPMEFMSQPMTASGCKGHAGYLASMQFLEQRQDLADHRAVGAWQCILSQEQIVGAASQ